jgi:hypothetical protein
MHDLIKVVSRVFVVFAVFSFFMSPTHPVFAEEKSSASKITFHVA